MRLAAGFSHRPFGLRGQITAVAVGCFNWHFAIMQPRPWTGHANPEKRNKNPTLAPISEEMGHHGHTMCMVMSTSLHRGTRPSTNSHSPAPTQTAQHQHTALHLHTVQHQHSAQHHHSPAPKHSAQQQHSAQNQHPQLSANTQSLTQHKPLSGERLPQAEWG